MFESVRANETAYGVLKALNIWYTTYHIAYSVALIASVHSIILSDRKVILVNIVCILHTFAIHYNFTDTGMYLNTRCLDFTNIPEM